MEGSGGESSRPAEAREGGRRGDGGGGRHHQLRGDHGKTEFSKHFLYRHACIKRRTHSSGDVHKLRMASFLSQTACVNSM